MNEEIKGTIGVSVDTNWFGYLFFTTDRLIVARTEQKRFSPEHTGPLMGIIVRRRYRKEVEDDEKRERKYMKTHPDNILAADKENYAIHYSDIALVEMKKPERVWTGRITITTTNREKPYEYPLRAGGDVFDKHVDLVNSLLPDRLSIT